jgi:hypothetical protein
MHLISSSAASSSFSCIARGIGHVITPSRACALRQLETGLRYVASKYVSTPLLFRDHKFDLRYTVVVRATDPPQVYIYAKVCFSFIRTRSLQFFLHREP